MKKAQTKQERLLRQEVRNLIAKILREEEETGAENQSSEEGEAEEQDSSAELDEFKARFIQKYRSIEGAMDMETVVDTFSSIFDAFGMSNEQKIQLLKSIRNNIVR